ncbi:MAG: hypothetical protein ACE15E_03245 [Acidobacteriota bacterium]
MNRGRLQLQILILICAISMLATYSAPPSRQVRVELPPELKQTAQALEKHLLQAVDERVELSGREDSPLTVRLGVGQTALGPESYTISSRKEGGATAVEAVGQDLRSAVYAAYDLADRIRYSEPIDGLQVREAPYSTYRQIVACSNDHDFYLRLLRHMPRWRMNALLLYSAYHQPDRVGPDSRAWFGTYLTLPITYRKHPKIKEMIEKAPDFIHVSKSFPRLLEQAKAYGIDLSLKFQILSYVRVDQLGGHYFDSAKNFPADFPELFPDGKAPDWSSPAVYDFIRDQLEELFDRYPGLAGITATSDEMSAFNIGHVASKGSPEDRKAWTRRMVETVEEVCARYGKRCYWDLHGSGPVFVSTLIDIARSRPGGLRLRAESTEYEQVFSDKFPSYPFERVKQAGDGMCDHDIHMEMMQDFPWLPNILDHFVVRHTMGGVNAGLRGGGAMWYIYRPHYSPINSLGGGINMELLSRLLWNPKEPVDAIWDRWLRRRFGPEAAASASQLLRSTQEVINQVFYFDNRNATFWFQYGFPKDLNWLMRPDWGQLIEYFQPPGTPLYAHPFSAACRERAIPISQMRAEKQAAVAKSAEMVRFLKLHRKEFQGADYKELLPRYLALSYYARAAQQLVEILYNFTNLHIRAYDPACKDPRKGMEQAMATLGAIHAEMVEDEGLAGLQPDVYYRGLKPFFMDNVPTLLEDLRFHDQVLSSGVSGIDSLPEDRREKGRRILQQAAGIREKFERNLKGEMTAEDLWARRAGVK